MKAKTLFIILVVLVGLIACGTNQIPTPVIQPAGGVYTEPQTITISCSLENVEIRYTLDGSDPTPSSSLYQEPFILPEPTTIKAKAFKAKTFKSDWHKSEMATVRYEFRVYDPKISLVEGTYPMGQTLSISCPTPGTQIRYTTNGTEPTQNSDLYIHPIAINTDLTIKARAFKDNWYSSYIISKSYFVSTDMVFVEGGTFQMGSKTGKDNEKPVHNVTVSSFSIGKYEVTQKQWIDVMGYNPLDNPTTNPFYRIDLTHFKGDHFPVANINWYDALVYCNRRSIKEGLTPVYTIKGSTDPKDWGRVPTSYNDAWDFADCNWNANGYRLPTEAEWEYAARGGNKSKGFTYSGSNNINEVAWYRDNSGSKIQPVGRKKANELGIYDMSGNVNEWCWDMHGAYTADAKINPNSQPITSRSRIVRGGCYRVVGNNHKVYSRSPGMPFYKDETVGFRCVRKAN